MKVEVILTADEKLLNVLDKFANALSVLHNVKPSVDESTEGVEGVEAETPVTPQVEQPTTETPKVAVETKEPKQEPPKVESEPKQKEAPKVESEPKQKEAPKAEIAEQQAAKQVASEPVIEAKPTVEEPQADVPDAPTLRTVAKKLMEAGKQAELKATLNSFTDADGEPVQKLSGLQDVDKAKFVAAVNALLGE